MSTGGPGGEGESSPANPFATRFIRPSAARYLFPAGQSAAILVRELQAAGWRGQIVGPHGSGKSTLLQALLPEIAAAGRTPVVWRITSADRPGPFGVWRDRLPPSSVLVIDGYEQLKTLSRALLALRLYWAGAAQVGLLVTTHTRIPKLPVLIQTEPTLELALRVVAGFLPPEDPVIRPEDIAHALETSQGDIREMLLLLYDVYRNRTAPRPSPREGEAPGEQ